jgi:hypothetical protein
MVGKYLHWSGVAAIQIRCLNALNVLNGAAATNHECIDVHEALQFKGNDLALGGAPSNDNKPDSIAIQVAQ